MGQAMGVSVCAELAKHLGDADGAPPPDRRDPERPYGEARPPFVKAGVSHLPPGRRGYVLEPHVQRVGIRHADGGPRAMYRRHPSLPEIDQNEDGPTR